MPQGGDALGFLEHRLAFLECFPRAPLLALVAEYQHRSGDLVLIVADGRARVGNGSHLAVPGNQQGVIGKSNHQPLAQHPGDRVVHPFTRILADDVEDFLQRSAAGFGIGPAG